MCRCFAIPSARKGARLWLNVKSMNGHASGAARRGPRERACRGARGQSPSEEQSAPGRTRTCEPGLEARGFPSDDARPRKIGGEYGAVLLICEQSVPRFTDGGAASIWVLHSSSD